MSCNCSGCAGCSGCGGSDGSGSCDRCTGCQSICGGSCTDSCTKACANDCTGNCNGCTGTCYTGCKGTCKEHCDNACTSESAASTIANLAANIQIGKPIIGTEIRDLQKYAYDELIRRSTNPTTNPYDSNVISDEYSNKLFGDIKQLDPSVTLTANGVIYASNYQRAKVVVQTKMLENLIID